MRRLNFITWGASSNDLKIEGRVAKNITDTLKSRGHNVKVVDDYTDTMRHAGAILITGDNHRLMRATDPRGDGLAAGY
ncbi:gamma-glutamyltransferase [Gilliamella apis]|uniref:gamma-glutamyltransferase n=1 Tax=Gilliamella apis TaxID=1970738 RepID=UPI00242A672C|nr:gamma-glutamyltransferase [Gilliamella apis]